MEELMKMPEETYKKGGKGELVIENVHEEKVQVSHLRAQIEQLKTQLAGLEKKLAQAKELEIEGA